MATSPASPVITAGASDTLPSPGHGCNTVSPTATSVKRAQHSAVIVIDTPEGNAFAVLWVGDR
jgi:hypothetical protein